MRKPVAGTEKESAQGPARMAPQAPPVEPPKPEMVNHPKHYNQHPSGIECIDVIEHMTFNVGTAIKYLWRAGLKDDAHVEDLRKAEWYVKREIERLTRKPDEKKLPDWTKWLGYMMPSMAGIVSSFAVAKGAEAAKGAKDATAKASEASASQPKTKARTARR